MVVLDYWYTDSHSVGVPRATEVFVDWRKQKISDLMMFFYRFSQILTFCDCLHKNDHLFWELLYFLFTLTWRPCGPGHKQITKVWKSIFSTFLVMSAVQMRLGLVSITWCQSNIGLASQSNDFETLVRRRLYWWDKLISRCQASKLTLSSLHFANGLHQHLEIAIAKLHAFFCNKIQDFFIDNYPTYRYRCGQEYIEKH